MTESGMTDRHGEMLVDEFLKLAARMGVADEMLPAEIVLKIVGQALGRTDREIATLRSEVAALQARLDARP